MRLWLTAQNHHEREIFICATSPVDIFVDQKFRHSIDTRAPAKKTSHLFAIVIMKSYLIVSLLAAGVALAAPAKDVERAVNQATVCSSGMFIHMVPRKLL